MPRIASGITPRRNFHVPLPDDLYLALQAEAQRSKRPANALARDAIAEWLGRQRRSRIDDEIRAYAAEVAGTSDELDPDLEAAGLELLASEE
jgi:predicted transcriptional regulator